MMVVAVCLVVTLSACAEPTDSQSDAPVERPDAADEYLDIVETALGITVTKGDSSMATNTLHVHALLDAPLESAAQGLVGVCAIGKSLTNEGVSFDVQLMHANQDGTATSYQYFWNPGERVAQMSWGDLEPRTLSVAKLRYSRPTFDAVGSGGFIGSISDTATLATLVGICEGEQAAPPWLLQ